jgi:predicted DNA repair protein MutK
LLSYFAPQIIDIVLLLGAGYLAYEGAEKIYEWIVPHTSHTSNETPQAADEEELRALEDARVKSAIKTDFVLSIEIVIIALSSVANETLLVKIAVTTFVAVLATIGVYGLVALLVRMDDMGYALARRSEHGFREKVGLWMVRALPKIIRIIGVVGTIALLTVAGGIVLHSFESLHHYVQMLPGIFAEMAVGLVLGTVLFLPVALYHKMRS